MGGQTDTTKGRPPVPNRLFFFNIVQMAFDPPPLVFEHLCCGLYRQIAPRLKQNLQQHFLSKGLTPVEQC